MVGPEGMMLRRTVGGGTAGDSWARSGCSAHYQAFRRYVVEGSKGVDMG